MLNITCSSPNNTLSLSLTLSFSLYIYMVGGVTLHLYLAYVLTSKDCCSFFVEREGVVDLINGNSRGIWLEGVGTEKQDLLRFCMEDKWEKVVDMYNKYPNIQYTKLTVSKDTALHITVLESTKDIVVGAEPAWVKSI